MKQFIFYTLLLNFDDHFLLFLLLLLLSTSSRFDVWWEHTSCEKRPGYRSFFLHSFIIVCSEFYSTNRSVRIGSSCVD